MKKEFEKFIIWYLPFCFLTAALATFLVPLLTDYLVESYPTSRAAYVFAHSYLVFFISSCHKFVAAFWLWNQKKKENGRFILWALFGLFQGIWAVAFYIGLAILEEIKTESKPYKTN